MSAIQDFYDGYETAKLGGNIPDGRYEFVVTENVGTPEWFNDDGRQCVECTTEVVGGEYEGAFGPRIRFQTGGYKFTRKNRDGLEVTREVTDEQVLERLKGQVRLIHGPTPPRVTDMDHICDQLADACVGDHFIANVATRQNASGDEFQNFGKLWSMDSPPEGFVAASRAADFTAP